MKRISKFTISLTLILLCFNSCVYSLFPIFTDDSLVFIPNLDGKWVQSNKPLNFILIESNLNDNSKVTSLKKKGEIFIYKDYAIIEGDTIRDKVLIERYKKEKINISSLVKRVRKNAILSKLPQGKISDKTYWLTVSHEEEITTFRMHLARIGDDIFMDLFPIKYGGSIKNGAALVWLPVHTFF